MTAGPEQQRGRPAGPVTSKRRPAAVAAGVFILALVVRLLYLWGSADNPTFHIPIVDSQTYHELAANFAQTGELTNGFFRQPFFYPFCLSMLYAISGSSILFAKVVQLVVGAGTCVLVMLLGRRVFDQRTGTLAGIMAALYGPLVFYQGELLATGWAALWTVVLLLSLLRARASGSVRSCLLVGLCGGLSVITRPTFVPFLVAGLVWLVWALHHDGRRRGNLGMRLGAVVIGLGMVTVPVAFLCQRVTGQFTVLPANGALNLHIGNNPDYCRTITARPGPDFDRLRDLPLAHDILTEEGKERFFRRLVVEYALGEPAAFAKGLIGKAVEFISSREIPNSISIHVFRSWSRVLALLVWKAGGFGFPFGVLLPLTVVGVVLCWRRLPGPVWLFLLLYPLSVILVHVNDRYRLPVVPVMAVVASAGCLALWDVVRRRRWGQAGLAAGCAGGTILLATLPGPFCLEQVDYRAETYSFIGMTLAERGDSPDRAVAFYREALQLKPECAEAHNGIGVILARQGRLDEAAGCFADALRFKPEYPEAHYNLAMVLAGQGRVEPAVAHLQEVVRLSPGDVTARFNLGVLFGQLGRSAEAAGEFRAVLEIAPDHTGARQALELLRQPGRP